LIEPERFFRLSNSAGSLGLSCSETGVALAGVPLLFRGEDGFEPRSEEQLRSLMVNAYGIEADGVRLTDRLGAVARALNAGDIAQAMISAVLLKLPELDWDGAVRIAKAEEALMKYSEDQPRDWHGRWTTGGSGVPFAQVGDQTETNPDQVTLPLSASPTATGDFEGSVALRPPEHQNDTTQLSPQDAHSLALPDNWVHLPPGKRIDELADFAEWVANAKPEDEPALRAEVKRLFYDVGDVIGGDSVNGIISDAVEPGISIDDRRELLDNLDWYTHTDPAEVAQFRLGIITVGTLFGPAAVEAEANASARTAIEAAAAEEPSGVWKLGWAARGQEIDRAFGNTLGASFPVIDDFAEGVVTSIKSIDLNAGTYQSGSRLLARINSYIDDVSRFDGTRWNNVEVSSSAIEGRSLRLVIPKGSGTAEQQAAISAARARAETLNRSVKVIVSPF
jgi:hypothetical protein